MNRMALGYKALIDLYDLKVTPLTAVVDMPDQDIDLLMRCVIQNGGNLSAAKKKNILPCSLIQKS